MAFLSCPSLTSISAGRDGQRGAIFWQDTVLGDWRDENPIMSLIHVSVIGHARRNVLTGLIGDLGHFDFREGVTG
jgi:hypothetical protein